MKLEEDVTMDDIPRPKKGKLISEKDQKSRAMCSSSAAGDVNIIIIDSDDDHEIPDMTIEMVKRSKLSAALSDSQSTDSDDGGSCSTTYMNTYIFNASN